MSRLVPIGQWWTLLSLALASACVSNPKEEPEEASEAVDSGEPAPVDADEDGILREADCDDSDPAVGEARARWADADHDGHGDEEAPGEPACWWERGWSFQAGDCDDTAPDVFPEATELCNGVDDDCDGLIDDEDPDVLRVEGVDVFVDADGDGWGDSSQLVERCELSEGLAVRGLDCDDSRADVHPDAEEVCGSGADDNCDGWVGSHCGLSALAGGDDGRTIDPSTVEQLPLLLPVDTDAATAQWLDVHEFDLFGSGRPQMVVQLHRPWRETNVTGGLYAPTEEAGESGFVQVLRGAEGEPSPVTEVVKVDDFNGDTLEELVLRDALAVSLLESGMASPDAVRDLSDAVSWSLPLNAAIDGEVDWAVNDGGDLNGDGLSELIVTTDLEVTYLIHGTDDWSAKMAACDGTIEGCADGQVEVGDTTLAQRAGRRSASGFDIDGDGLSDLFLRAYATPRGNWSEVHAYDGQTVRSAGGATVLFEDADLRMIGPDVFPNGAGLGIMLGPAGDLNQDGYEDLVLSQYDLYYSRPRIYAGSADWFERTDWSGDASTATLDDATLTLDHTAWVDRFGPLQDIESRSDVTGDGRPDLLLSYQLHITQAGVAVIRGAEGWEAVAEASELYVPTGTLDRTQSAGVVFNEDKGIAELAVPVFKLEPTVLLFSVPGL